MSQNKIVRILVVDDSPSLREVIKRYISSGIAAEFYGASNGLEAETVLQENALMETPIDLVILDWMMPKVSGFEFLQKIRTSGAFVNFPKVIMLSAETYPDQINAAMHYNVEAYIKKPFTQEELVEAVKRVLESRGLPHAV